VSIQFRWLGVACFEFRLSSGEVLIVDPYIDESMTSPVRSEDIPRADVICISHGHFDHVLDVGKLANRLGSRVICSREVAPNLTRQFGIPAQQIRAVTAGEVVKQGSLGIEVVRARHVNNRMFYARQLGLDPGAAPSTEALVRRAFEGIEDPATRDRLLSHMGKYPAGEQLNYVFQFPGNLRFHFFGSVPEPELLGTVESSRTHVLVLQILWGMEEKAVEMARASGASIVIPSHHDPFFPGQKVPDMEKVRRLFGAQPGPRFLEPAPGEWHEIALTAAPRQTS
jgi:L-ascorbate metabolism protein UlaG (beta-lactamase superfamily)